MKQIIFRDDDVRYIEPFFETFLRIFMEEAIPVSLAAIPSRLDRGTCAILEKYLGTGLIEIVQHGFSHKEHEPYAELPDSRSKEDVRQELEEGKRSLEERFGQYFCPVFTPPWHQITKKHYDNIRDLFMGVSAIRVNGNKGVKIDYPVNINAATGSPVCFKKSEEMVKELSDGLNIVLLHHDLYEKNEDKMEEFIKVIRYAKENKIQIVKFSDLE